MPAKTKENVPYPETGNALAHALLKISGAALQPLSEREHREAQGLYDPEVDRLPSSATMLAAGEESNAFPGGKSLAGLGEWICRLLPDHVYYAEPFAGKAAIHRLKTPALATVLIDKDPDVTNWLKLKFAATYFGKLPPAITDFVGGNGRGPKPALTVINGCGLEFVEQVAAAQLPELLLYIDPPYLREVRTNRRCYRFEMTNPQHVRLLKAANACTGPVAISGYESDLYRNELQRRGWDIQRRKVITRGGTPRIECLWRNAAACQQSTPIRVQYHELGPDYRVRERVKKKVDRWVNNFSRLPEAERRAIIRALLDSERSL